MKKLPEKMYYSISEVAEYTGVKAHVLRYWESEFPTLRPRKNRAGNRSYRRKDIEEALLIQKLLYEEGYKIDGARKVLKDREAEVCQLDLISELEKGTRQEKYARIRRELGELLEEIRKM